MTSKRLSTQDLPDGKKDINFTFDGKIFKGFDGDSLAAALLANGVSIVGRSFKYHRPRGIMSAGAEEANGIAQMGRAPYEEPNVNMATVQIFEGMEARSVNCWPNAAFDLLAVASLGKPFFVSGFYYKMFKWPSWKVWSPFVRRMAGLGKLPKAADPDSYDLKHDHVEILIVGAGPAGLRAALEHGKLGKQVLLVEQDRELGGALLFERSDIPSQKWRAEIEISLNALENVSILTRTVAAGYYDHNMVTLSQRLNNSKEVREKFWHVRADKVILATGAIERPLVFANNDLPHIMLASAVRHYANRYDVTVGQKIIVATNNDDAYRTAIDLHERGVGIVSVIDVRPEFKSDLVSKVMALNIPVRFETIVVKANGSRGIHSVEISKIDAVQDKLVGPLETLKCDALAMSGGWSPVVHLHSQSGGKLRFDEKIQAFVPSVYVQENICIGAANGDLELADILGEGATSIVQPLQPLWDIPKNNPALRHSKRWVDYLHDVTATDVALAARENYTSVEHFKRYTTTGMAMDQGKTSNINALAILGKETDRAIPDVGTTKFRPPYIPVTLGSMAGRNRGKLFRPIRHLPCHQWHSDNGAFMDEFGSWMRPVCYKKEGETTPQAYTREVHTVRAAVGILDYSPLGKIDVQGKDAAEFLHKFYVNNVKNLKIGHARYGLMLNEQGSVMEDGVFAKLADNHYWLTTTSGHAGMIAGWLDQWRQCEWADMDVVITSMTTGWGTISLQGPKSRELLSKLNLDLDISNEAFPHMTVRQVQVSDVDIRVLRTSFTGELGYEVSIPISYMQSLWTLLMAEAEKLGGCAFGIEALLIMRLEKGYIHVGGDTDSATTPDNIGFGAVTKKKKEDFIGKRSLRREFALSEEREILVGFASRSDKVLPIGGIVMAEGYDTAPAPMEGRITSSCYSPTLEKPIAIGLLKVTRAKIGSIVNIYDMEGMHEAEVVGTCFYDKEGIRVHG